MRVVATSLALIVVAAFLTGCATPYPLGSAFTEVRMPVAASGDAAESPKMGVSECESVLGLVATGDASIEAAKKDGGITKIHYVDWEAKNILGIYGKYKTTVYGE